MSTVDAAPAPPPDRTWLDGAFERGERVRIDPVDFWRAAASVLLLPFLVLGWCAGKTVTAVIFAWAAAGEGYTRGRATHTAARDGLRQ